MRLKAYLDNSCLRSVQACLHRHDAAAALASAAHISLSEGLRHDELPSQPLPGYSVHFHKPSTAMGTPLDLTVGILGIAAFAQQLTTAVVKIKRFVDDVKDAPEELRDVISQVENFGRIMSSLDMEPTRDCEDDPDAYQAFSSSLALCQQAVDRISRLALHLEEDIAKGRLRGRIHAVYKKNTLESMLRKLDRSKFDLHIARTSYEAACQARTLRGLQRLLEKDSSASTRDPTPTAAESVIESVGCVNRSNALERYSHRRPRPHRTRFSFPSWICEDVWESAFSTANGRWTFAFTTYRVMDFEMEQRVWQILTDGKIEKIAEMLSTRELGLHDKSSSGYNIYHVSIDPYIHTVLTPM